MGNVGVQNGAWSSKRSFVFGTKNYFFGINRLRNDFFWSENPISLRNRIFFLTKFFLINSHKIHQIDLILRFSCVR
ncbi:hypothetical protein BGP_5568 [Beggiatoa sp. PS]|nr:hypothetical protein BGP_5568 [Beggiatoa sp. PS]